MTRASLKGFDLFIDYLGLLIQNSQMLVKRDLLEALNEKTTLEALLLWGARQVGKTTLLDQLNLKSKAYLDDLGLRTRAQNDPAFFLEDLPLPCLIDEVQYAPQLFPQIKYLIDERRRANLRRKSKGTTWFFLTGSNKTLLDKNIKESLAGRCHLFNLHGFSVKEIVAAFPELSLKTMLLRGGFPEVYTRDKLSPKMFYNDYILSFIEKDVAYASGIEKLSEFHTVLRLLSARTGQFINVSDISQQAGVDQKTVSFWINILKQNAVLDLVSSYATNLSKRIVKMKKLYFFDTGLCARLQGHEDETLLWNSVQVGALFETLVFSELAKTRDNFLKDWQLFTWRTKEKQEIDFILKSHEKTIFIEVKLGIQSAKPFELDSEAKKVFEAPYNKLVVTAGGDIESLDRETKRVPIQQLGAYLLLHA